MKKRIRFQIVLGIILLSLLPPLSLMADTQERLAKQLQNPVADLISLPFQLNYDQKIGPSDEGERWIMNIQPVVPFHITPDWNLISRTILPVIHQDEVPLGNGSRFGIGDTVQSLFISPSRPTKTGWIWGAGPVFLLPTGSETQLTGDKWGLGPTAVALKQNGPWTYGGLVNHIWSVAGDSSRNEVNASFLQPFISYTTPTAWSLAINTESTYDWQSEKWSIPVNLIVSKVLKIGSQTVSLGFGPRYWLESPETGPEGFGLRFNIVLLFPK